MVYAPMCGGWQIVAQQRCREFYSKSNDEALFFSVIDIALLILQKKWKDTIRVSKIINETVVRMSGAF